MVAAAVLQTLSTSSDNSAAALPSNGPKVDLESLVENLDSASSGDVSAFHSTVQNAIAQNSSLLAQVNGASQGSSPKDLLLNTVDNVQKNRVRTFEIMSKTDAFSPADMLELQRVSEDYLITTQFLSKAVNIAVKDIDTLVHMQ